MTDPCKRHMKRKVTAFRAVSNEGRTMWGVAERRECIRCGDQVVQFTYRGRDVTAKASYRGYAAVWLKEHPYTHRTKGSKVAHEAKALKQAEVSVCSILRDWIKGQVMAIETGVLTFEGAFLGQILLPSSGATVLEAVMQGGLLPALAGPGEDRHE